MIQRITVLLAACAITASAALAAGPDEYLFHVYPGHSDFVQDCGSECPVPAKKQCGKLGEVFTNAGSLDDLKLSYDSASKRYTLDLTIAPPADASYLAKALEVIVSDGANPVLGQYRDVSIYFDATNPGSPVLTAYPYNTYMNDNTSHSDSDVKPAVGGIQSPDKICTSADPASCPGWVIELSVTDNGDGSRTFHFVIDVTAINSHILGASYAPGTDYEGIHFESQVGTWLFAYGHPDISFAYGADGFIESFNPGAVGTHHISFFDGWNLCTYQEPICDAQSGESYEQVKCEGQETQILLDGSNSFIPGDPNPDFNWTTDCEDATVVDLGDGKAHLILTQPGDEQSQQCKIFLTVGNGESSVNCEAPVSAEPCDYGCEEEDLTKTLFELDGVAGEQRDNVRQLTRKLKLAARDAGEEATYSSFIKKTNKRANELYNENWTFTWQTESIFLECTNTELCFKVDLSNDLTSYDANSDEFLDLAKQTNKKIKKLSTGAKRLLKRAKALNAEALALSKTVPGETDQCV